MIVKKPIGPVKINGTIHRLNVGRPVPDEVMKHWKDTDQIKDLKKIDAISDGEKKDAGKKDEKKKPKSGINKISGNDEDEPLPDSEGGQQENPE